MIYRVFVKPNSRRAPAVVESDDGLVVYVRAKATDGKANAELIQVLGGYFGVAKTQIVIRRGAAGRHKVVEVFADAMFLGNKR
jgi:uncharacterized protein (TIGR00251 family)